MRTNEIILKVDLDENNVPEGLRWNADDKDGGEEKTDAFSLSIWDPQSAGIVRLDLWTKDMTVPDMKMFILQSIEGLAQTLENSTGDSKMAGSLLETCQKLREDFFKEFGTT